MRIRRTVLVAALATLVAPAAARADGKYHTYRYHDGTFGLVDVTYLDDDGYDMSSHCGALATARPDGGYSILLHGMTHLGQPPAPAALPQAAEVICEVWDRNDMLVASLAFWMSGRTATSSTWERNVSPHGPYRVCVAGSGDWGPVPEVTQYIPLTCTEDPF